MRSTKDLSRTRVVELEDGTHYQYQLALSDEQWYAWNVRRSLGMSKLEQVGDARLSPYEINQRDALVDYSISRTMTDRGGRWTPPGEYVKLEMLNLHVVSGDDDSLRWAVMMSDTPDEANDHAEAIARCEFADTVLVHGLGLGCFLHTILATSHVTHVDVVELSPDVVRLVGPHFEEYVSEGRLTIHQGDCLSYKWPRGMRWDVVWHDVWPTISMENLRGGGLSYEHLLRKFGSRADWQGAWGHRQAREQRKLEARREREAALWTFEWNSSEVDRRVAMLTEAARPSLVGAEEWASVTEQLMAGGSLADLYRDRAKRPMTYDEAYWTLAKD